MNFSDEELEEDTFAAALSASAEGVAATGRDTSAAHDPGDAGEHVNGNAHPEKYCDVAMLQKLRASIGREKFISLLSELLAKADDLLGALDDATAREDTQKIAARSHELKGMAANFGLIEVTGIAASIEAAAKTGRSAEIRNFWKDLPAAHERAKAALRHIIKES